MARAEDLDVDIAPIFNIQNDHYRQKFTPPPPPRPLNEMEQEFKYKEARKEKERNKKQILDRFNNKYKGKYDELELQVQNLADQGNSYGKYIKQR